MSWVLSWQAYSGVKTSKEAFEEAQPFIEKSIKLGFQKPDIGYYIYYKWDWEKARELLAKYSTFSHAYENYYFGTGDYDSAIIVVEEILITNPLNIIGQVNLLFLYALNGDVEKRDMQIALLEKLFGAYSITHTQIATILLYQREIDRARPYIKKSDELSGGKGYSNLLNAIIRAIDGEEQTAHEFIEDVKQGKYSFDPNWAIATMYYFLEEDELALDFLEKAIEQHEYECMLLNSPVIFSRVYDHTRYQALLEIIDFPKK
jgi:tetratricopeptide (TPR) repeat protein